jgi:hypothetical protein
MKFIVPPSQHQVSVLLTLAATAQNCFDTMLTLEQSCGHFESVQLVRSLVAAVVCERAGDSVRKHPQNFCATKIG